MKQQEAIISRIRELKPEVFSEASLQDKEGYVNRVYGFLNAIPEGKIFTVEALAETENIELFTQVVCLYICEVKDTTVSFLRDDFKQFRKN